MYIECTISSVLDFAKCIYQNKQKSTHISASINVEIEHKLNQFEGLVFLRLFDLNRFCSLNIKNGKYGSNGTPCLSPRLKWNDSEIKGLKKF